MIIEKLIEMVGRDNATDQLEELVPYSYDASMNVHRPDAVVWPESTEQVIQIVKFANEEKIPIIPRGAGTSLSGGVVPIQGGIVIDLSKMNRILEISIENRYARVEAGVICDDLNRELAKHGFVFPPDPASSSVATIGGNVATNAGGIKGAKYGTTRDYVLGLQVVLPTGERMRTGAYTMKSVSGYDLAKLFVGAEGTLGVITEVTLKINPLPRHAMTAVATYQRLEDAGRAIFQTMTSGVIPSVMEIMDKVTLRSIKENTDIPLPEAEAMILTETDGFTWEEVEAQMEVVLDILKKNHPIEIKTAKDEKDRLHLWKARKSAYATLARVSNSFVLDDVTVPISRIPQLLVGIQEISQKYRITVATFGHAGDGNLHPQILFDEYDPDQVERTHKVEEEIFRLAIRLNGTLSGEHGIGLSKAAYMDLEHDPVEMELMRKIKRTLDPNNIMNPGKRAL
ncbi:MAG: FAD-binding protein [Desulfobacterota bacterium]|nr:FAD-binding protein [Thermodesulfobacteriota bacterium]